MINLNVINTEDDYQNFKVPDLKKGEQFHVTVLGYESTINHDFKELLDDPHMTFAAFSDGERGGGGGGIDLFMLLKEPLVWGYTILIMVGTGFLNAAGEDLYNFFKSKLAKPLADQFSPSKLYVRDRMANLTVIVPAKLEQKKVLLLEPLIMEKLVEMNGKGSATVLFAPEYSTLVIIEDFHPNPSDY